MEESKIDERDTKSEEKVPEPPTESGIVTPDGTPVSELVDGEAPSEAAQEAGDKFASALLVVDNGGSDVIGFVLVKEAFKVPEGKTPDLAHLQFPFMLRHAYKEVERATAGGTTVKKFGPFEMLVTMGNVRNAVPEEAQAFREWVTADQTGIEVARGPLPNGGRPPFPMDRLARGPKGRR